MYFYHASSFSYSYSNIYFILGYEYWLILIREK